MEDVFVDALDRIVSQWDEPVVVRSACAGGLGTVTAVKRVAAEGARPEPSGSASLDPHSRYLRAVWHHLHQCAAQAERWVYIYGAGAHGKWLLTLIKDLPRTRLRGFLDDAPTQTTLGSYPVTRPDAARVPTDAVVLLSSDQHEPQLYARARAVFGEDALIVRLYETLPTGPYPRPESPEAIARRREATRRARRVWGGGEFVGPYEQSGSVTGFLLEQWLWKLRERIRGRVLDMSTPRHWHNWVYDLPDVDRVLVSDLDRDIVLKGGHASRVDHRVDFAAESIDLPAGSFDTVLCMSILEHCADPARMLTNLHHVLAAGGTLFLATPYACVDGHCRPDYWRFGRDGLALLAGKTPWGHIETSALGDVGGCLADVLGSDHSAADGHDGIPLITCLTASKA